MRQRLTNLARSLRRRETTAEERLWRELRNRQLAGWKFKRQVPRGKYVLDFFCADAGLVIEVDGYQHLDAAGMLRDAERTAFLESEGLRVLRLTNADVSENLDGSIEEIFLALGQQKAPSPGASRQRRAYGTTRRPLPEGRGYGVPSEKVGNKE
jgi:very-short-patch-repair endonuclease